MAKSLTKASPVGCSIMLLGLASFVYTGLCFRALYLLDKLPKAEQKPDLISHLWIHAVIAIFVGTFCLWYGWRSALASDMSDPENPNKSKIRF